MTFIASLEELILLFKQGDVPRDIIDRALQLIDRVDERFFVKVPLTAATLTGQIDDVLKPSDRLIAYISALRAGDWPKVRIIEPEGPTAFFSSAGKPAPSV